MSRNVRNQSRPRSVLPRVVLAALAVLCAVGLALYFIPPDGLSPPAPAAASSRQTEPAGSGEKPASRDVESASSKQEPGQEGTDGTPPAGDPLSLVTALTHFESPDAPLSEQQAEAWVSHYQQLTGQGATAVPAIQGYLSQGENHLFTLEEARKVGSSSVRDALFDALRQVGGPVAIAASLQELSNSCDPWEIALLARNLDQMAPDQHRQKVIEVARDTLGLAKAGNLPEHDVAPLFEVLATYGGTEMVPVLADAIPRWAYYATTALARLPEGAGIPTLAERARKGHAPALQMLAQVAPDYQEARETLLQMVEAKQIAANRWPYLAAPLTGDELFFRKSVLGDGENLPSGVDLQGTRIKFGNQNFYRTPGTARLTSEGLNQRLELVDSLLEATDDPPAVRILERARKKIAGRLAVARSPRGIAALRRKPVIAPGLRDHGMEAARPLARRTAASSPSRPGLQGGPKTPAGALKWDALRKEIKAEVGALDVIVKYEFTNVHDSEVQIKLVQPSCGCTTMELPKLPWKIATGTGGEIGAKIDLRGKRGTLSKTITVHSSSGQQTLSFKVTIPAAISGESISGEQIDPDRMANMKLAAVDRQIVFKDAKCAACHAEPAHGKLGEELYQAACGICHNAPHRATMVPDLAALKFPTNSQYWRFWIRQGRAGSLMPAFAESQGGPLTTEQIDSLTEYLTETISNKQGKQPVDAK